ncbi:tape measure protein [Faecalibacillus intestinalis]|uniref:tape measure protein n=1 Tax=Faecalibacillus intestinalis TaxID=1982626 RepID=UPI0022E3BC6B|nr:tape measure protein [Faecalibacillus intestinalis]
METYSVKAVLSAVDSNFTSTMKTANSSLAGIKTASESATSSIMKIASGIGVFKALSAGANMLTSSVSGAVDRYDTLTKYPKVLTNLGYSTQQANKSTVKLKDGIQGLPTALDDVVKTSQRLTVLTGNLDKSTDTTLALNNAFLASSASVSDTSRGMEQYIQMLSKGTVDMQSWRTLQETMGYALSETAKQLGIASGSSNELYSSLQSGQITFDQFNDALIECSTRTGGFAEMALEASGGIKTSFANIQTAIKSGMEGTISAIDTMLSNSGLPKIQEMLDDVKKGINKVFGSYTLLDDGTKKFNGGLVQAVANFDNLKGLAMQTGSILAGLTVAAGSVDYIKALGGSFDTLNNKIPKLNKTLSTLQEKSKALGNTLSNTLNKSSPYLDNLKNKFSKLIPDSIRSSIDNFKNLMSGSMSIGKDKVNAVGDSIAQVSFKFQSATGRFSSDAPKMWKVFNSISNEISKSSRLLGNNIGKGLKTGTNVGMKAMSTMMTGLTKVFAIAMKSVGPAAILGLVVAGLGIVNNQFGSQIDQMIATVVTQAPKVISNFVKGITSQMPMLASSGAQLLVHLSVGIAKTLPLVVNAGMKILNSIIQGISANAQSIVKSALLIVGTLGGAILNAVPQLLGMGLQVLTSITQGILDNMPLILVGIQTMITNITTAIQTKLPTMIQMGVQILQNIATGIVQMLPQIVVGAIQIITTLIDTISGNLPTILNGAVEIINTLVGGLINNLPQIINATVELIEAILNAIITNLPQIMTAGVQIILKLVSGLISAIPHVVSGVTKVAKKIISTFKDTNWLEVGVNVIKGIAKGISSAAGQLWDAAKKALGSFKDKVLGFFGIHSPSRWGKWVGRMLDTGVAKGIGGYTRLIGNQAQKIFNTVQSYVGDISNLGMQYSFAGDMGVASVEHYVDYNDDYINSNGGDNSKNEYYFTITNEMDGKTLSKETYKYDQENAKKDEKFLKKLRGDK